MSDVKHNKLLSVRHKLQRVAEFLVDYLPLANAHNSDFFVHRHWEGFVDRMVGEELLSLSPEDLSSLPSRTCPSADANTASSSPASSTQSHDISPIILKPKKKLMVCKFHRQKSRQLKPKWDMSLRPNWRHDSLDEFVAAANQHTLANMTHILSDAHQLRSQFAALSIAPDKVQINADKPTVTNFMSSKKGYEVDEMAQMCASIMQHYALNKVIDIGSGRGYLGCQLALAHGLQVLGIDYSTTNTNSAKIRAERLEKHWEGLVRNAKEDAERGYKVKRGKNYRGRVKRRQKSESDSVEKPTPSSQEPQTQVEVNLSEIFQENPPSPSSSPVQEDELRKESEINTTEPLVIYLSEPRVRRPRPESVTRFSPAKETAMLYRPITHYVTVDTDLQGLVKAHFGDEADDFLLTGLHTCGNLASSILQLYISNPSVRVLCNVGCCYHLLEEEFVRNPYLEDGERDYEEVGFPLSHHLRQQGCQLGRNARMLASQATDRAAAFTKVPGESLFWRAVLQVILRDVSGGECRQDWQVGKLAAKCSDFTQYVFKAMDKLNMQHQLTAEKIAAYEAEYSGYWKRLQAFVQLRAVLAPCIETLLLLDRLYYLLEQECIQDAHLVRLFDPVKSPRCYAIIAVKSAEKPSTTTSSTATLRQSTPPRTSGSQPMSPKSTAVTSQFSALSNTPPSRSTRSQPMSPESTTVHTSQFTATTSNVTPSTGSHATEPKSTAATGALSQFNTSSSSKTTVEPLAAMGNSTTTTTTSSLFAAIPAPASTVNTPHALVHQPTTKSSGTGAVSSSTVQQPATPKPGCTADNTPSPKDPSPNSS